MKSMPSSEYRKSFAGLTEPVAVTVHGHVIGTWTPTGAKIPYADTWEPVLGPHGLLGPRTFTPAPKPGKRKRGDAQ